MTGWGGLGIMNAAMPYSSSPARKALPFTLRVRDMVRAVPRGKVASYRQIAALAGDARQARQVSWILHATSESEGLPWHRIINARGSISLPLERGGREQARRLRAEGVPVGPGGAIDIAAFGWRPRPARKTALETLDLNKLR
jgi:methylated-DNA-protein-cysteine methyltransferase related protein